MPGRRTDSAQRIEPSFGVIGPDEAIYVTNNYLQGTLLKKEPAFVELVLPQQLACLCGSSLASPARSHAQTSAARPGEPLVRLSSCLSGLTSHGNVRANSVVTAPRLQIQRPDRASYARTMKSQLPVTASIERPGTNNRPS